MRLLRILAVSFLALTLAVASTPAYAEDPPPNWAPPNAIVEEGPMPVGDLLRGKTLPLGGGEGGYTVLPATVPGFWYCGRRITNVVFTQAELRITGTVEYNGNHEPYCDDGRASWAPTRFSFYCRDSSGALRQTPAPGISRRWEGPTYIIDSSTVCYSLGPGWQPEYVEYQPNNSQFYEDGFTAAIGGFLSVAVISDCNGTVVRQEFREGAAMSQCEAPLSVEVRSLDGDKKLGRAYYTEGMHDAYQACSSKTPWTDPSKPAEPAQPCLPVADYGEGPCDPIHCEKFFTEDPSKLKSCTWQTPLGPVPLAPEVCLRARDDFDKPITPIPPTPGDKPNLIDDIRSSVDEIKNLLSGTEPRENRLLEEINSSIKEVRRAVDGIGDTVGRKVTEAVIGTPAEITQARETGKAAQTRLADWARGWGEVAKGPVSVWSEASGACGYVLRLPEPVNLEVVLADACVEPGKSLASASRVLTGVGIAVGGIFGAARLVAGMIGYVRPEGKG